MKKSCVKFSASVPADVQDAFWINIFIFGVIFFFFLQSSGEMSSSVGSYGLSNCSLTHTEREREGEKESERERERLCSDKIIQQLQVRISEPKERGCSCRNVSSHH